MDPPFPEINGKKILVSTPTGSAIGKLATCPNEGLFGVRIDFVHPPAYDVSPPAPIPGQWVTVGHFNASYLLLSENEIRSIKEADHQDYKFTLALAR